MTYMDHVEVIVEKEMYARDGVHKGMQGWTAAELILELIAGNPVESVKIGYTLIEGESVIDR